MCVQCTEECLDKLSKDMSKEFHMEFPEDLSKDTKLPLISACVCAVKRMYFISLLIFSIDLAQFGYIWFPNAKDSNVLIISCIIVVIAAFVASIQKDYTLKSLPELTNNKC